MFLAKIAVNRPVLTTMILLVFVIFGGISLMRMNLNNIPDVKIPYVVTNTIYPGAGPKEIETQITKKLEDAIATVSEIKTMTSYSLDGVSIILIEFDLGKDIDVANQEVKDKIDQILNELPDDAELPIVQKFDIREEPIVDLVLSGNKSPIELYEIADKQVSDRFAQIAGVAKVDLVGGQERQIHVVMDKKIVYEQMVSLPYMMQKLGMENMDLPAGYFQTGDREYTVRLNGVFENVDDIKNLEIPTAAGAKKLRQFAEVLDTGMKVRQRAIYFDNRSKERDTNVVRLSVVKATDGNVVEVADMVREKLPEIQKILPEGVQLAIVNDNSIFVRSTVNDTFSNILLGVLFTSLVLLFFLSDLRSTIIVALSMPMSILSTFLLLSVSGVTLNSMSLMGLSVSVGVLVSNSIVVIENIFRHKYKGRNRKDSAYVGTSEVAVAVIAATATNIVVFVPLASIQSIAGQFLRELALAAAFSTIFSLIMSFTLTPMLARFILPSEPKVGPITKFVNSFEAFWERLYKGALRFVLHHWLIAAATVIVGFLATFVIVGVIGSTGAIGFEFMPITDNGKIRAEIELPEGYNLEATEEVVAEMERRAAQYDDVERIITNVGKISDLSIGTNKANMEFHLVDAKDRDVHMLDYISMFIKDFSDIPNARIKVSPMESMGAGDAPITFFLQGQDLDTLEKYKEIIMARVDTVNGLLNFDNSSRQGKPEITITPRREKLSQVGASVMDLALTVRASIEGMRATDYRELGEEYEMHVTVNDRNLNSPEKVGAIPIITQMGTFRLSELADIDFTTGYTQILHSNKYPAIQFSGYNSPDVATGDLRNVVGGIMEDINLPAGYTYEWSGNAEMEREMFSVDFADFNKSLVFAFLLAFVLTYMLLAAILEHFVQPAIILMTLPLAFGGVFIALYATGQNMGITASMGMIMLLGIVVNNAILILDYANQLIREENYSAKDALIEAGPVKLKPITMATVAIILGMLPMALGIGEAGAEMRMPLGVVSIGGLASSTVLGIFVIPALYFLWSEFIRLLKFIFGKRKNK